ncbi:forkhead box protein H1-like [Salmo trutta]|uniref:forkhead box protein H1-like n=1 Tax=Salmo trutta TaxID=8032 RepID=UPI00112FD9DB|nr:forkhead box protein H1-like [Salmo trutta]
MQSTTENIMGTLLHPQAPSNVVQRRKNQRYGKKKSTTYLGLIAYVIQDSPDKMLTFSQLMDKLGAFLSGDRKGIENNIRVCLSSNDCFVKVPVSPYMPHSKKNFWKVDESQITAKMARRHFKGILDLFPDLSTKVRMEAEQISERFAAGFSPKPTLTSPHMQNNNEVKFRGAFSIESILNRDSTSRLCPRPAALAVVSSAPTDQPPLRAERGVGTTRMSWDSPPVETNLVPHAGDGYPSYTTVAATVHGLIGDDDDVRHIKKMRMCADPSYLTHSRPSVAPRFADPPRNCYLKYPVATYTCNAHHFGL